MTSPSEWRQRRANAVRNYTDGPVINDVASSDAAGMQRIFGAYPTAAGKAVTEVTAMRTSTVFACVRIISSALASTPIPVYQRAGFGQVARKINHPLFWLFNEEVCPRFSAASFWEYVGAQILLRGDSINVILRDKNGVPNGIIPVPRQNVMIQRNSEIPNRLVYRIALYWDMGPQENLILDQDDVLHFPGFGFNGLASYSVIGWAARQAIGTALAADEFAAQFFGSGAHVQYALQAPSQLTPQKAAELRDAFSEHYSGTGYTGRPLVLTEGITIEAMSMNAVDAQLLQSRQWQVIDIARAFGVPPFLVGETDKTSSWGSGIETMNRGFLQYTMSPHFTRIMNELNRKLFPARYFTFMKFDEHAMLRGDVAAQGEFYQQALGGTQSAGWMTQNEVRHEQHLAPIAGGDTLFSPEPPENAQPPGDPSNAQVQP